MIKFKIEIENGSEITTKEVELLGELKPDALGIITKSFSLSLNDIPNFFGVILTEEIESDVLKSFAFELQNTNYTKLLDEFERIVCALDPIYSNCALDSKNGIVKRNLKKIGTAAPICKNLKKDTQARFETRHSNRY